MRQVAGGKRGTFVLRHLPILALGAIALTVSVPLMTNYCIDGVDVSFYLRRLGSVRPEDLFLLLPSLMVRAGMERELAYKLLLAFLNVATAVVSYFCFRGIFQDKLVAVTGSMLYAWTPYRLNDLYCRADLGEAVALSFLPVVFYGLYLVCRDDAESREYGRSWMILALGYTLIFQAYLLSFLVIAGFTALFIAVMWRKIFRRSALLVLFKAAVAFLACNAWLILLLLKRVREGSFSMAAFRGEQIQSGGIYFSNYLHLFFLNGSSFRTFQTGTQDMQPQGVGFAVAAGALLYLWLAFVGRYREKGGDCGIRNFARGVGISGAVIAVMATNSFPWDYVQRRNDLSMRLIESLQSPARLLQVVAPCFVLLACAALLEIRKWEQLYVGFAVAIVTAALALWSVQYLTGDIMRTRPPRSLYGEVYGNPDAQERFLPENLDISPWDYGKYVSGMR